MMSLSAAVCRLKHLPMTSNHPATHGRACPGDPDPKRGGANSIERMAGNGLLDRRALLSHGAALAGAMGVGAAGTATGAAAEPLAVDPWTLTPGIPVPAYGVPSRFEEVHEHLAWNAIDVPQGCQAISGSNRSPCMRGEARSSKSK
jgi:hypothetical protein